MLSRLPKLLALLLLASCVTTAPPPDPLAERWFAERKAQREQIAKEQYNLQRSVAAARLSHPFFWQASKDGKTSWLLGTMHEGIESSQLPNAVWQLLGDARVLVTEADLADAKIKSEYALGSDYGREEALPASNPLDRRLSDKAWNTLCWDLHPISPEVLRRLPPTSAMGLYVALRAAWLAPQQSSCLDCDLVAAAKAKKVELAYLESFGDATVAAVFRSAAGKIRIDERALDEFLTHEPLATVKKAIAERYRLQLAYKRGDLDELGRMMGDADNYAVLIKARNDVWLAKILGELAKGGAFVAVGAGHYTGAESLLKLLEGNGYQVKRFPF